MVMKITTKQFNLSKDDLKYEALVIGNYSNENTKEFKDYDKKTSGLLSEIVKEENFESNCAEVLVIRVPNAMKPKGKWKSLNKIILVGLGKKDDFATKQKRKAIAASIRQAKAINVSNVCFAHVTDYKLLAETAILVNYSFEKYKTKDKKEKTKTKAKAKKLEELIVLTDKALKKSDKDAISSGEIIADATCIARDLVWEPACTVTPTYLANQAKKIKAANFKIKVLDRAACQKLKMGAYLAVAQGSDQPPKFIEMVYSPKGKIKKHIAIVGKGVTFDSGGLSLKPSKAMEMMKEDMSGSAATIGVMNAIAKLQPKGVKITAIIAATENMPSGKAYRPGDVITAMNGKTIEVNNTDAEGRLTLADAVAYVSKANPDEIIDIATLTGACMVALGNVCAGLMTNDQDLLDRVKASAEKQGELMWQLPLYDEYRAKLKSSIADLINAGAGGQAGAQNGGLFIQEFIGDRKSASKKSKSGKQIPWLHIDIAGPCWYEDEHDWSPRGASGMPVRTLVDYVLSQA